MLSPEPFRLVYGFNKAAMACLLMFGFLPGLIISPILSAESAAAQPLSTATKNITRDKALPGYYLEIKRSYVRAYPGWQKKTIALLKPKGFVAFNGYPKKQTFSDNMLSMEFLEKTSKPINVIGPVYVGPYRSKDEAEHAIPKLLAALKPLVDAEKKNDELENRYLLLVGVVKVK